MKLTLTNFRSFEAKSVELSEKLTLISGHSGSGKTSLFMALVFAFTGEGKKLVMFGKKTCCVKMVDDAFVIVRSKGPNRLLVTSNGKTFEDNDAQGIINVRYPQWQLGYVPQRIHKSFFAMTCAEKLAVIEGLAFEDSHVESLQAKCKNLISTRKESLKTTRIERNTVESVMQELGSLRAERVDDVETQIDIAQRDIHRLEAEANERQRLDRSKYETEQILLELQPDIDDVAKNIDVDQLVKLSSDYERYERAMKALEKAREPSGFTQQELSSMIDETREMIRLLNEIKPLDGLISDLRVLKTRESTHSVDLTCPACFAKLGLVDNALSIKAANTESISVQDALQRDEKRHKLMARVDNLVAAKEKLKTLESLYPEMTDARQQLARLLEHVETDKLRAQLESSCDRLKCEPPIVNASEIIEKIKTRQRNDTLREIKRADLERINNRLAECCSDDTRLVAAKKRLTDLRDSQKFMLHEKQWTRIKECCAVEKELEVSLPTAVLLQSLVKRAENIALQDVIDRINLRTSVYLNKFFDDETIDVKIVFADKIDTVVRIGGNESDPQCLSGGEYARIALAMAIAMAEMNNLNLLLLDESLASLDSETSERVLCAIASSFDGQVVVIAHQITQGCFDKVIEL